MSGSNCCFLTYIQVSQEAAKVVWYSHLFKNFPQFVVIYTVKGFSIFNEAEVDIFWKSLAFSMIQHMLAIWPLVLLPFLNPAWTSGGSWFMTCWSLAWRILSFTLLACEMSAINLSRPFIFLQMLRCFLVSFYNKIIRKFHKNLYGALFLSYQATFVLQHISDKNILTCLPTRSHASNVLN